MKDDRVKEIVYQAVQATKSENSGLISDLRSSVAVLKTHYEDIKENVAEFRTENNKRFDTLETKVDFTNGKVRKLIIAVVGIGAFVLGSMGRELMPFLSKFL